MGSVKPKARFGLPLERVDLTAQFVRARPYDVEYTAIVHGVEKKPRHTVRILPGFWLASWPENPAPDILETKSSATG